jgi:hypothetical protein
VNLLKNDIGIGQANVLASILKEHPTLKSLCGNTGDETELDMSGKEMSVDGAIMLAPEIINNGALQCMYRRHTLPVKKVVHDVYPRVPPLCGQHKTQHTSR